MGGGGGSSSNTTTNEVTVNTRTDVNIDLIPLAEILADSQEFTAQTYADGQMQSAEIARETEAIALINSELDRKANAKALKQFDRYIEHAKNGLVLSGIAAGLLYYSKKSKKRRKSK